MNKNNFSSYEIGEIGVKTSRMQTKDLKKLNVFDGLLYIQFFFTRQSIQLSGHFKPMD